MIFSKLFAGGFAALIATLLSTGGALAVEASATTTLNVRAGPGATYGVVDTLDPGEVVEVGECATNGWCYIFQSGANGWVSSSYLTVAPAPGGGGTPSPDCSLSLTIGSGGTPTLRLNCGSGTPAPTPAPTPTPTPPPIGAQACFYTSNNYTGAQFCYGVGVLNSLNFAFNNRISSVKLFGGAKARLCQGNNLGGLCRQVGSNRPVLGSSINNRASSVEVFTGPTPAPVPSGPVTFSTGVITLRQSFMANLDNGRVGAAGADIWYKAVTPVNKFIAPRNGAKLALGSGTNRGFAGCRVAVFSGAPISVWALPVGSYVCVKTNAGRISQFRLNGYSGTTMRLGYTTWRN